MRKVSFEKCLSALFIMSFAISLTPAQAQENQNNLGTQKITNISFGEQDMKFPSFFSPKNQPCDKEFCDWRSANFGHGFIDYPRCISSDALNCVKNVEIILNTSQFTALTYLGEIEAKKINIESENFRVTGGAPTIWAYTGSSGDPSYYLVKAFSGFSWNYGDPVANKIELGIIRLEPVNLEENIVTYCVVDNGLCFKEIEFDTQSRIRLSLNVPSTLGGFFMGRLDNPEVIQELNVKTGQNELVITANPVKIPQISVEIPDSYKIPSELNIVAGSKAHFPSYDGEWNEHFDFASKFSGDRVTRYVTRWGAYAISPESTDYAGCAKLAGTFIGSGSTNAMRYDFNPPRFSNGSFIFKLSGLHFKPDGASLELGQYQVSLKSKFAKCMYKSTNGGLMAIIEITSSNGERNVTTTTSQEVRGWFKLSISALTFSSQTIKVTFKPKPQKSIICRKAKASKTIKGVNPRCPTGWKAATLS